MAFGLVVGLGLWFFGLARWGLGFGTLGLSVLNHEGLVGVVGARDFLVFVRSFF